MLHSHLDYTRSSFTPAPIIKPPYWGFRTQHEITKGAWSQTNISHQINLPEWQTYLQDLPRDTYVDARWKRMSWLYIDDDGEMNTLANCPMAQGGQFNDADTMADKLRFYPALEDSFLQREDVQAFVKAWADLWGINPKEPILMQINGVKGDKLLDPLQGQGIHQDGSQFLSILVLNRENVTGGHNTLYHDKAGQQQITHSTMAPGDIMHIRDNEVFHSVSSVQALDTNKPFERFIIIINCRFNDAFQNKILREHFPDVVLNEK
ncbi:2OG-Fe dioxygenase family protein [Glaciecola sp. 2405UD65-10]|uniref:2OG-Fe dioxygenase family protein n=1 Tax=Glaciecola sp. 2405UD65-10 TaxID=3397244 RepID=UPI003B58CA2E